MRRLTPAVLELARKFKVEFQGLLEIKDYGRFVEKLVIGLINEEDSGEVMKDAVKAVYENLEMEKKAEFLKMFMKSRSSLINVPVLLETIITTITAVFGSELEDIRHIALEQNHRFCDENIDVVAGKISLFFNEETKNEFIEELYYRLNEKERIFLFEETQQLIVL